MRFKIRHNFVSRVLLTMCNGEVGNCVMVKNLFLLFYISNDNVTLIECFYKVKFLTVQSIYMDVTGDGSP